ncbi:MAG: hypothetical protein SH809_11075 [Rhodothermales bacterium]|nr:hypothetical protein [Rhodothermales bacterium]
MPQAVHYVPILTTLLAIPFTVILYRHWRRKPSALYLAWWMIGVAMYGVGTLTESLTTLLGWQESIFRAWYISGALLGGAPLAQGTIYLLFSRKTAHRTTAALLTLIAVASVCVMLTPIDYTAVEPHRLSGRVMSWQWVRAFSPFINLYAVIFLVGGAAWSAWKYARERAAPWRMWGNVGIAVGAILPGIGGTFTRMGHVEVLYVTEIVGLLFIWAGYHAIAGDRRPSVHANQQPRKATR